MITAIATLMLLCLISIPANALIPSGEIYLHGGFMTEKEGFRYVQVRGSPDRIGYQHGIMLYDLIERSLSAYAHATERGNGLSWSQVRLHGRAYWFYVPGDQRTEIEGIARGASEMGARNPNNDPVDWIDILSLNAIWDIWWRASPPGNPLWWLPDSSASLGIEMIHHCSAFVATGDATADGGFVIAQSLWMPYFLSPAHAVFMDVIPDVGNRFLMEVTAGMIWSGTEWYQNSAGLVIAETTLGRGPYIWGGTPSFVRLRKAVQFADSIDSFKDIMLENTNGAYCGDYLLADAKTNEVAILELGAREWAIKRTMNGFLPSCNYPWDETVAREMGAPREWDHGSYPRYVRWGQIRERDYGNITVFDAMEYLGDHYDTVENKENPCSHTLCGHVENASGYPHGSLDSKATNRSLAYRMETFCRFGHSCGQPFIAADHAREHPQYAFDDLIDIIPRPFAAFSALSDCKVTLLDGKGDPVPYATVNFTSLIDGATFQAASDGSGVLRLEMMPSSLYTIKASGSGLEGETTYELYGYGEIELTMRRPDPGPLEAIRTGGVLALIIVFACAIASVGIYRYAKAKRRT